MSTSPTGRSIWGKVLKDFLRTLTPSYWLTKPVQVGSDYLGNRYFEDSDERGVAVRRGRRRWIESPVNEVVDHEVPSEWQSWLQHRRRRPPEETEIQRNLEVARMKKVNAARLAAERGEAIAEPQRTSSFPVWEELETQPGKKRGPS